MNGHSVNCHVITSEVCGDTRCFHNAIQCRSGSFDDHEGAWLRDIDALLSESGAGNLAGLTRDSDYVLVTQLALERGFVPIYKGEHLYRDQHLQHSLRVGSPVFAGMKNSLIAARHDWPEALAGQLPLLSPTVPQLFETFSMPVKRPADSPGYLVSWYFSRSGA